MTLVTGGLLLGLVGLVWVMVINIVSADRRSHRLGQNPDKPVRDPIRRESKALKSNRLRASHLKLRTAGRNSPIGTMAAL